MFVPGKPFLSCLLFADKAMSQKGASLGYVPALLANIRLGRNTLAYYKKNYYTHINFFDIGPRGKCYETFLSVIYDFWELARVLVPGKPS